MQGLIWVDARADMGSCEGRYGFTCVGCYQAVCISPVYRSVFSPVSFSQGKVLSLGKKLTGSPGN